MNTDLQMEQIFHCDFLSCFSAKNGVAFPCKGIDAMHVLSNFMCDSIWYPLKTPFYSDRLNLHDTNLTYPLHKV